MKARLFALPMCCATGVAFAQTPPDRPPGPPNEEHQLDRLTALLDLTGQALIESGRLGAHCSG
jgi:hypothetical protein